MRSYEMLLERDEFLCMVHTVSPPAVVGLRLAELFPPNLQEQLTDGRTKLEQRGAFQKGASTLVELWEQIASALAHPWLAVAHMRTTPGFPTRKTVYYKREAMVRHDYTLSGVHRLALLAEDSLTLASVLEDAELIDCTLHDNGISLPSAVFESFGQAVGREEHERAEEMLCAVGFSRQSAHALTEVWQRPVPRNEIAFFRMEGTEIVAARQLVLVQGARSAWSIIEEPIGSDLLQVATTSRAATSRLLAGYFNEIRNEVRT